MSRLFLLLVLAGAASAQWRLSLMSAEGERVVGEACELGSTSVGLEITAVFRLRNLGTAPAATDSITIRGADFLLEGGAPATLDAGGLMDFRVRFRPRSAGSFSAALQGPHGSVIVRASAIAAPIVRGPSGLPLGGDSGLEWAGVVLGTAETRRILVENASGSTLTAPGVALRGADFAVSGAMPAELAPAQSAALEVSFTPAATGPRTGELTIGTTVVRLVGYGVEPAPPALRLLADAVVRSGEQHSVRIRLDAPARTAARGEIVIQSASADATLLFSNGARSVSFDIRPGDQERSFPYQTGTTAGTIGFRARIGDQTAEAAAHVAEEPIRIAAASGVREGNSVVVKVTAMDNTLTTSVLTYVFFDREGKEIGRWSRDYTDMFFRHFTTSTMGGAYALSLRFPVTGDVMQIHSAEVEMTNRLGVTRSDRIRF